MITGPNYQTGEHRLFINDSRHGKIFLKYVAICCPNEVCKELTVSAALHGIRRDGRGNISAGAEIVHWQPMPESSAVNQPEYIPAALHEDYYEACRILTASPKASATLSRRCLQGMIRDIWSVKDKPNLFQEIDAIKNQIPPDTWEALDSVRKIGNIGAHMEKDVNKIVDVDPGEADLLIRLIGTLFKDWYIDRHERQERNKNIIAVAKAKEAKKKGTQPPAAGKTP